MTDHENALHAITDELTAQMQHVTLIGFVARVDELAAKMPSAAGGRL